jgi:hypothetical protein
MLTKIQIRPNWLWGLTLANVFVAALLLLMIFAILSALAAFAAYVTTWPIFPLLIAGVALSAFALRFAKKAKSVISRRVAYATNGCLLAFDAIVILILTGWFFGTTQEIFMIPEGYQGDIYVFHGVAGGEPETKSFRAVTYRIPKEGILRVQAPIIDGFTRRTYYYEHADDTRKISSFWPTTIARTPDNLKNDWETGVFFPRSGNFTGPNGCEVKYDQFYVGTKAYLLGSYRELDMSGYLQEHPIVCINHSAQSR